MTHIKFHYEKITYAHYYDVYERTTESYPEKQVIEFDNDVKHYELDFSTNTDRDILECNNREGYLKIGKKKYDTQYIYYLEINGKVLWGEREDE